VGCPLWREDGSVFCICCWSLPAQSFSGPSPLGLATVFYCLRFETSHFVASYDSQGHGGGIRPRIHTGAWELPITVRISLYTLRSHLKENTCHVSECVFIGPLPSTGNGADHIENTSCNTFSIVACAYFGRCLEKGLHVRILNITLYLIHLVSVCNKLLCWRPLVHPWYMMHNRLQKIQIMDYTSRGRRSIGRPKLRWKNQPVLQGNGANRNIDHDDDSCIRTQTLNITDIEAL
jgi:hypothetical protein